MNLKKSKTSVHKLFLALCILGSGIHVHAVEKTAAGGQLDNTINKAISNTKNNFVSGNIVEEGPKTDSDTEDEFISDRIGEEDPKTYEQATNALFSAVQSNSILGGINVHGVESSTGTSTTGGAETINTFVGLQPVNQDEAIKAFIAFMEAKTARWDDEEYVRNKGLKKASKVNVENVLSQDPYQIHSTIGNLARWGNLDKIKPLVDRQLKTLDGPYRADTLTSESIRRFLGAALCGAASVGNLNIVQYFTNKDFPLTLPIDSAFHSAVKGNNKDMYVAERLEVIKYFLSNFQIDKRVSRDKVRESLLCAAAQGHRDMVQEILGIGGEIKIETKGVLEALGKAENVGVRDILFNDDRINAQALEPLVQEFVRANNPSPLMVRGLKKIFAGPNALADVALRTPLFKVHVALKNNRPTEPLSKVKFPKEGGGGVGREILNYDPLPNLSVKKDGVHLVSDLELAARAWRKLKNIPLD